MIDSVIAFKATSPFIKQRKSDKGWIVEFEVDQSQFEVIRALPTSEYEGKVLTIEVKDE